jgi:hypothetical protein
LSEEKLDFSRKLLIYGNLAVTAWLLLGFLSLWVFNQIGSVLLLLFNAFLIYGILRRFGCSSCYNCKSCTSGFGRIAGVFFGTGQTKKGSVGNRKGIIVFAYVFLFPLPAALLSLSILGDFSLLKIAVLLGLIVLSAFSLATWRGRKVKA